LLFTASLAIGTLQVRGQNPTFGTPVNLSNTPTGNSQFPQTAASGNYVYVVWQDDVSGRPEVYFRVSSNNGTSFGTVSELSSGSGWAENPQVAVSGNNVYVVWSDNSTANFKTYVRASSNYGASFAPQINLGTTAKIDENYPEVAASANNVYAIWVEAAHTPIVNFRASADHGTSFASSVSLSGSSGTSFPPQLAVSGSSVSVAWRQNVATGNDDVFFDASSNNGTSFLYSPTAALNLSNNAGESFDPAVAAYGSNVYVAWPDNTGFSSTNYHILFRASTSGGSTFSSTVALTNDTGISLEPEVAASGSSVYVIRQNSFYESGDILFRASGNSGASFASMINLSNDPGASALCMSGNSCYPRQLVVVGSEIYVAWDDQTTAGGIDDTFFTSSNNGGLSFGSVLNLSNNSGYSTNPTVAASGNDVYVVWQDDTPSTGFYQTFFTVGTPTVTIPPVANPANAMVSENQSRFILLTGSDSSGLSLTFSIVSGPAHGMLGSITSVGPNSATVLYTPNANYLGADSFSFKVNNGKIDSAPGTVSITVQLPASVGSAGGGRRLSI